MQGRAASFVEWIGGDYTNVVGLPLALTGRMLANAGIPALKGQFGRHQVHESPHAKAIGLHVKLFIQSQKACSPKFGKTWSYTYERPYLRSVALRHVQSVPMYRKEDP